MSSHIFISHVSKDNGFVKELRLDLEDQGLTVWVDARNLRGGAKLAPEINRFAVNFANCDAVRIEYDQKTLKFNLESSPLSVTLGGHAIFSATSKLPKTIQYFGCRLFPPNKVYFYLVFLVDEQKYRHELLCHGVAINPNAGTIPVHTFWGT